jgi:glycosyltransferase involved in cell wall biosynthesis
MTDAAQTLDRTDITVVIPAYRAEATIRRTLDSVLSQTGVSLRVVVVIDGRLDRTAELLASYPKDRVSWIEHPTNLGAAISRNDGLAEANSDYVMFLDADDFLEGPLLSGLVSVMRSSGADIGFGPMQVLYEADLGDGPFLSRVVSLMRDSVLGARPVSGAMDGGRGRRVVPDFTSPMDVFRKWHLQGIFVAPCSVLWRAEFIREIGGWDSELTRNDDGELVMRAILKGAKFVISDQGQGVYVKHSGESLSTRMDNLGSMIRANEKLLAIEPATIPKEAQHHVCAGHYFNIAWQGYYGGRDDVAEVALKRSRAMGFGTRGRMANRVAARLLGVRRTSRLIARLRKSGWAAQVAKAEDTSRM